MGGWVSENKLDCLDPTMLHFVKLLLLHRHLLRTSMTNVDVNVSLGLSDRMSDASRLSPLTETSTLAVCPLLSPLW